MIMNTNISIARKKTLCLLIMLVLAGFSFVNAQMVTVVPAEYPDALTNPLMGFREDYGPGIGKGTADWNALPYTSLVRHYIYWNDINNLETDGVQKIIDFCNARWKGCEAANVRIIPRVILQYGDNEFYFPSYLTAGDYTSQKSRDAVVKMIKMLGEAWDNDPRVAWVQTGIIGKWGEQESPVGIGENVVAPDNSNWATIMGQAFALAFTNKMQLVRNQNNWSQSMGTYWDSFAHTGQYSGAWTNIKNMNAAGRYLASPVEGEVAYNWGASGLANFGTTPNETCTSPAYFNFMINTIKQLHCSGLGWISGYTPSAATATGANLIQKAFGYRFKISEFKCAARTEPGGNLTMSAKVKNIGSAVLFENYPVAFVLVNETTRQIVFQSVISGTNTKAWRPGSNYDWDPNSNPNGSSVYLTPAVDNLIYASIPIPSSIAPGQYLAAIAILDPSTQKPGVFFAVPNFFKESQSQPLCRIGIGADAANSIVTGPFDNPVTDDMRYYTLIPTGPTYSLTTNQSSGGIISPSNANFAQNSTIIVTAVPNSGYKFDSWGGSLTGVTNPTTLLMNANKTISASFSAIPPEPIPWLADFDGLADGITAQGYPTTWTATPATGNFGVLSNEIAFNNVGTDGVFMTAPIDISSGPVTVSLKVRGGSGLDVGQDFLRFYKKIDNGPEVLINSADGTQVAETWTVNITSGSKLVLIVRAHVTSSTEYYFFDKLNVVSTITSTSKNVETQHLSQITVYANQHLEKLYVEAENLSKPIDIEVYNLSGVLLYALNTLNPITEINANALKTKGMVMVKVVIQGKTSIFKTVIY